MVTCCIRDDVDGPMERRKPMDGPGSGVRVLPNPGGTDKLTGLQWRSLPALGGTSKRVAGIRGDGSSARLEGPYAVTLGNSP